MISSSEQIRPTPEFSTQNCKLSLKSAFISRKELIVGHVDYPLSAGPSFSTFGYLDKHLFTQKPKIQNAFYTMGSRIKGLSTQSTYNRYHLSI